MQDSDAAGHAQAINFGERLRRYRARAGLTQEELAERTGLSVRGLSDLERGVRRFPYPDTLARLADVLELGEPERTALLRARRKARSPADEGPTPEPTPDRLPTGMITFMFTDIEASTSAWEHHPDAMRTALARHDELIESLAAEHAGHVVRPRGEGDSRFVVFVRPSDAVAAACAMQHAFVHERWPTPQPLRVRIALHTGEADLRAGDYYGSAVNRCARLRAIAHGGQLVLSGITADLVRGSLPISAGLYDLGLHRLKDVDSPERVWQLTHPDLPSNFPPLASLYTRRHDVPVQLSSFVGREEELDEVRRMLETTRLLTLAGPGGIGKTRLATRVVEADVLVETNAVGFVDLAPLTEMSLVPQAVAASLSVRQEPGRALLETLIASIGQRRVLLLLDNCEHVIQACAELAAGLLLGCPNLRILATSREPLGVEGEVVWRVPPLPVPSDNKLAALVGSDAVQLFLERAQSAQAQFVITLANASAVAQVCRRLEGLPLAIELAAARTAALAPRDIADRLDQALRLLVTGARTAAARQRTLEATISWSYDLLDADEQYLFERLAVFAGGFSLDGAEASAAERRTAADILTRLVAKSLVQAEPQADGSMRYRLLEPLRQFALDRLAERVESLGAARRQHAAYVVALVERAARLTAGPEQLVWIHLLDVEWDNVRAAHTWAREQGDSECALRLAAALSVMFARPDRRVEGRARLEEALAIPSGGESRTLLRARVFTALANLAVSQSDLAIGAAALDAALSIAREHDDPSTEARAAGVMALLRLFQGDPNGARDNAERSLALARRARDRWVELDALRTLVDLALARGDPDEASKACEAGLRIARAAGDPFNQAMLLNAAGDVARWRGDFARAGRVYEEALAIFQTLSAPALQGLRHNLGYVALGQGDPRRAAELFLESAELYEMSGRDRRGVAECVMGLGATALQANRPALAANLLGAAEAELEALGTSFTAANRGDYERSVAGLRAALGPEQLAVEWANGRGWSLEYAVAEAARHAQEGLLN